MNKFIHLRGYMACGKTTTASQFIEHGDFKPLELECFGKQYPYLYDADQNTVVTGKYGTRACGGLDGVITNKKIMLEYLLKIMKFIQPKAVVFEAVMYGVTVEFATQISKVCSKFGYEYVGINLQPPLDVAFQRVFSRNGGKLINVEQFERGWERSRVASGRLKQMGLNIKTVDTSKIPYSEMWKIIEAELWGSQYKNG